MIAIGLCKNYKSAIYNIGVCPEIKVTFKTIGKNEHLLQYILVLQQINIMGHPIDRDVDKLKRTLKRALKVIKEVKTDFTCKY